MITHEDIDKARSIYIQLQCKLWESPQNFVSNEKNVGAIVCYPSVKNCRSFWVDIEKLNEFKLKVLFKRHKEVPHNLFIQEIDSFYRVGWKLK